MIKALSAEVWKPLQFPGWKQLRNKYALSSSGRIASYKDDVLQDGKLLQGSITTGYKTLNLTGRKTTAHCTSIGRLPGSLTRSRVTNTSMLSMLITTKWITAVKICNGQR